MWDLPGPGLEPVSPALAGRFLTTAPPGKPYTSFKVIFSSEVLPYHHPKAIWPGMDFFLSQP